MILQKMKQTAEDYLGHAVTKAVITVPAYFNDSQRQATKDAGKIAGLDVLRIINEPTAAALAYGLDKKKDEKVAVFDLGGGTYDISVLELYDVDGSRQFEVKSTNGDTHLGGDDFDQRVIDWLVAEFKKRSGDRPVEGSDGAAAPQGSRREGQDGAVEHAVDGHQPAVHHRRSSRARSTSTTRSRAPSSSSWWTTSSSARIPPMEKALEDAGLKPSEIDEVLLVGGSTRIPKIQEIGQGLLRQGAEQGREPGRSRRDRRRDPGCGAHRRAEGRAAARRHAALARHRDAGRRDDGAHSAQHHDPDQEVRDLLARPTTTRRTVEIHVLQGERELAVYNKTIGKFQLTGIPPAPRGMPQVEVTFDIDANGILHVTAKDKTTGKEQKIRIEASSGLSDAEVDRMVKDAEKNADEDKKRRDEIDSRNRLDSMTYEVEKNAKEWSDRLAPEMKTKLDEAVERARKALRGEDLTEIQAAQDELSRVYSEAGASLYQQAGAEASASAPSEPTAEDAPKAEDVVEADYEIVDDKK